MFTKVKNLTKHKLTIISTDDVIPKDRYSGKFLLKRPLDPINPIMECDPIVALNVYEAKGLGAEFNIDGLIFQSASCYTEAIDGLNGIALEKDCLLVVSQKYAAAAKYKLAPYLLDRLFVPTGLVERDGKIVGATKLLKVAPYQLPTFYLTMESDFATKKMAIAHWQLHWNQLPPVELEALQTLVNFSRK